MSYEDKTRAKRPAVATAEPWDSARSVSPDPSWPVEKQLRWYQVASHILLLNCSEVTRRKAARAADREISGLADGSEPLPVPIRRRDPAEAAERIRAGYAKAGIPPEIAEAMIEATLEP